LPGARHHTKAFGGNELTWEWMRVGLIHNTATGSPFSIDSAPGVLVQQLLGIDPVALKRPAAEMMNKQIIRHGQIKSSPPRPLGQIIIIKEPDSKPLIGPADRLVDDPFHQQTKPRQLVGCEPFPTMLIVPLPGKPVHGPEIAIRHALDQLRRRGVIRHGTNETDRALSRQ
jgi:hypothetical protein